MTMMKKENFWNLIEQAKKDCGQDIDKIPDVVEEQLSILLPEEIVRFYNIYEQYIKNAHAIGIWDVARVMNKGYCSDDGFHYFKPWLIAQGKETYMNTLKNPDSLADISVSPSTFGYYQLESMNYVAHNIYEELTGENIYEAECCLTDEEITEIRDEIDFEQTIQRPRKWGDILHYLPNLCKRYMPNAAIEPDIMPWNTDSDWYIAHVQYMADYEKLDWFIEFIDTQTQSKLLIGKNEWNELCVLDNRLKQQVKLLVISEKMEADSINIGLGCYIPVFRTGNSATLDSLKSDIDVIVRLMSRFPKDGFVVSKKAYEKYLSDYEMGQSQDFEQKM